MKTLKTSWAVTLILVLLTPLLYAQESETQLLMVHEENVIVSEFDNYWKSQEHFNQVLADHNITDIEFYTHSTNDNRFWFVVPIENYAALDKDLFQSLGNALGEEGMKALFDEFAGTFTGQRDYVIRYHPDLSYKADELGSENNNFRVWWFGYIHMGKSDEYIEVQKEWKTLYEKTNAKQGYTVYTGGVGMDVPVIAVMFWAESPAAFAALAEETIQMQGEEREALWNKSKALLRKMERVEGWYHPQLSYVPETPEEAAESSNE